MLNYNRVMEMVDYKLIGLRLKERREAAGLTQEAAAEAAEITPIYLSKIENGHARPTLDTLAALCGAVGCELGGLLLDTEPASLQYQNERVVKLFRDCAPEVKPIALNLLEQLAKIQINP